MTVIQSRKRNYGWVTQTPWRYNKVAPISDSTVALVLKTSTTLKKRMLDKKLRKAKAHCPRKGCDGMLFASLNGPKNHMHCACSNPACSIRFIE